MAAGRNSIPSAGGWLRMADMLPRTGSESIVVSIQSWHYRSTGTPVATRTFDRCPSAAALQPRQPEVGPRRSAMTAGRPTRRSAVVSFGSNIWSAEHDLDSSAAKREAAATDKNGSDARMGDASISTISPSAHRPRNRASGLGIRHRVQSSTPGSCRPAPNPIRWWSSHVGQWVAGGMGPAPRHLLRS
jgi:hypothetical protein